jgi:hypothetical protein
MPTFRFPPLPDNTWNAVVGAHGYNVHSGQVPGLYTDMQDVGNVTGPVTITVPWSGAGYACVAAYDTNHYEGLYSVEVPVTSGGGSPPVGTPVLSVR